jgi:hypothetical protein
MLHATLLRSGPPEIGTTSTEEATSSSLGAPAENFAIDQVGRRSSIHIMKSGFKAFAAACSVDMAL